LTVNRLTLLLGATSALLGVAIGCSSADSELVATISLVAVPSSPEVGSPVTVTVTAHGEQAVVKAVAIDFEDDGTWDERQLFDQSSVTVAFTHTYDSAGAFTVRTQVVDANGEADTKSLSLIVSAPASPQVFYKLIGRSTSGGACYAEGAPATCDACRISLSSAGELKELGSFAHGAPVSVTQSFAQDEQVGATTAHYSCDFELDLFAGAPGSEVQFGHGSCSTNSGSAPRHLTCSITTSGTVP
jgi:PKD repeat protein